jgi:hypothetical protein
MALRVLGYCLLEFGSEFCLLLFEPGFIRLGEFEFLPDNSCLLLVAGNLKALYL